MNLFNPKINNTKNKLTMKNLANNNKTLTELEYEKIVVFSITWAIGGIFEAIDTKLHQEILMEI